MLVHEVGDEPAQFGSAGGAIGRRRQRDGELELRGQAGGRLDSGDGEPGAVRRMTMHRGNRARLALHDLEMHQDFAGAFSGARELVSRQIHQAQVLRAHESFGDLRGRA